MWWKSSDLWSDGACRVTLGGCLTGDVAWARGLEHLSRLFLSALVLNNLGFVVCIELATETFLVIDGGLGGGDEVL